MRAPGIGLAKDYLVLGVVGVAGVWVFVKYVLPKLGGDLTKGLGQTVGNTLNGANQGLGNNDLTNQQTDFGGNAVDYSGHGVLSTLGAETNALLGGIPASIGEWLGSFGGNDYDPNASVNRDQISPNNFNQATDLGGVAPGDW